MNLTQAFRIRRGQVTAFVGAGGKTTALFQLAHELTPGIVTTSTHLAAWQAEKATRHVVWDANQTPDALLAPEDWDHGVTLVSGPLSGTRLTGITDAQLNWLRAWCATNGMPLLVEADGSRQKPLKAPGAHEPAIPPFAEVVVVAAGLSGLGQLLTDSFVHRPEIFAALAKADEATDFETEKTGLLGAPISAAMLARALAHPQGGLKHIPRDARRIALLNQADSPTLQSQAGSMANNLLGAFDAVVVSGRAAGWRPGQPQAVFGVYERVGGVLLAAGKSGRFGQPKQLLDFHGQPFVRAAAKQALAAGLNPVIVVCGAHAEQVAAAADGLAVQVVYNPHWHSGQASSIRAGIAALPENAGAAVFLLADQPQVTAEVIRALVERHAQTRDAVLAPYVFDRRANPVLFDQVTFEALGRLTGDVGGRGIFSQFSPRYINWYDKRLLLDVDTPEDYARLLRNDE